MSHKADVYKVLIASPSDTAGFRRTVEHALVEWNDLNSEGYEVVLLPVTWEMSATPQSGAHPQSILNDQIVDNADIVVAIFWTRIGRPTINGISGSVEEIQRKQSQRAPVLVYFSNQPASPTTVDPGQLAALQEFKASMGEQSLYREFESAEDLLHSVQRDLTRTIRDLKSESHGGRNDSLDSASPRIEPSKDSIDFTSVINTYRSELRGETTRLKAMFDAAVAQQDVDFIRRVMTEFSSVLFRLIGALATIDEMPTSSTIASRLTDLATRAAAYGRMKLFLDGGRSYNTLVEGSSEVFRDVLALLDLDWTSLL
jgi:hypothetical protein